MPCASPPVDEDDDDRKLPARRSDSNEDEDSSSEPKFDVDSSDDDVEHSIVNADSSSEMEFDDDAEHFDVNEDSSLENFIVRPLDDAAEKGVLILVNTLARMKQQDKGPTTATESETAYLVTLKSNLVNLFKLVYDLISDKCKRVDQGRHVYKPQPMEGPASKSAGCYKVQVARGNNKGRVKTG